MGDGAAAAASSRTATAATKTKPIVRRADSLALLADRVLVRTVDPSTRAEPVTMVLLPPASQKAYVDTPIHIQRRLTSGHPSIARADPTLSFRYRHLGFVRSRQI